MLGVEPRRDLTSAIGTVTGRDGCPEDCRNRKQRDAAMNNWLIYAGWLGVAASFLFLSILVLFPSID